LLIIAVRRHPAAFGVEVPVHVTELAAILIKEARGDPRSECTEDRKEEATDGCLWRHVVELDGCVAEWPVSGFGWRISGSCSVFTYSEIEGEKRLGLAGNKKGRRVKRLPKGGLAREVNALSSSVTVNLVSV